MIQFDSYVSNAQMRLFEEQAALKSFRRMLKHLRQIDPSVVNYFAEAASAWSKRVLKSLDLSEISIETLDDERLMRIIAELLDRELDAADTVAAELSSDDFYLASLALEVDKTQQKAKIESTGQQLKRKQRTFTENHTATVCKGNQQVISLNSSTNLLTANDFAAVDAWHNRRCHNSQQSRTSSKRFFPGWLFAHGAG